MSSDTNPATVHVRGVTHAFGEGENRKQVLFDCCLDLAPGEIALMTGPSGSGKTTLLTLIGALRSVQAGQVTVLGRELAGMDGRELVAVRRELGFIFQGHNLFDSLTARENVNLALELGGYDRPARDRLAAGILTELGLGHRLDHKPQMLSGGQRQRVAVARALVRRPKLILADEPTAALDQSSGREVVEYLRRLARENGSTILMVTHDNRVLDVADRIVNMIDGRIVSNVLVRETALYCDHLRRSPLFAGQPATTLAEIAQKVRRVRFEAGQVIVRQGDEGDRFFAIVSGEVEVQVEEGGALLHSVMLHAGDFFGEKALLTGEPRSATVTSRTAVELLSLGKEEFLAALSRSKSLEEQLREALYSRR